MCMNTKNISSLIVIDKKSATKQKYLKKNVYSNVFDYQIQSYKQMTQCTIPLRFYNNFVCIHSFFLFDVITSLNI